jgi:hypothetical protein
MDADIARSDLAHEAEHAALGQNWFDVSIGSELVCRGVSLPMGSCFFKLS